MPCSATASRRPRPLDFFCFVFCAMFSNGQPAAQTARFLFLFMPCSATASRRLAVAEHGIKRNKNLAVWAAGWPLLNMAQKTKQKKSSGLGRRLAVAEHGI